MEIVDGKMMGYTGVTGTEITKFMSIFWVKICNTVIPEVNFNLTFNDVDR